MFPKQVTYQRKNRRNRGEAVVLKTRTINESIITQPEKAVKIKNAAPVKFSANDRQQLEKLRCHYEAVDRVKLEVLAQSSSEDEEEIASLHDGWQDDSKRVRNRFRQKMQAEIAKARSASEPREVVLTEEANDVISQAAVLHAVESNFSVEREEKPGISDSEPENDNSESEHNDSEPDQERSLSPRHATVESDTDEDVLSNAADDSAKHALGADDKFECSSEENMENMPTFFDSISPRHAVVESDTDEVALSELSTEADDSAEQPGICFESISPGNALQLLQDTESECDDAEYCELPSLGAPALCVAAEVFEETAAEQFEERVVEHSNEQPATYDSPVANNDCASKLMEPPASSPKCHSGTDDNCASPLQAKNSPSASSSPAAAPVTPKAAFEALRYRRHRKVERGVKHFSSRKDSCSDDKCASPSQTKTDANPAAPVTPKAAFQALRSRRHRKVSKGASHYKGVSQQQLLTNLQNLKDDLRSSRSRSNSWSQNSVERTMQRWDEHKQQKTKTTCQQRTAGFKYWQKQAKVMGHLDQLQKFAQMKKRASTAPKIAEAKWKAHELQSNFGSWLRSSRSIRERAAVIGGDAVRQWHRSDSASNRTQGTRGVAGWHARREICAQLEKMAQVDGTPFKAARAPSQNAQMLSVLPEELVARILLTSGAYTMGRSSAVCQELRALVETPYMWQLLSQMRWGQLALNMVESKMGWKFAYLRRDHMEGLTKEERQELELQNQILFLEETDGFELEMESEDDF